MTVALKDQNSVASAIFESSTSPGVILRGQIDQITGRILVDLVGGGGSGYQQPLSGGLTGTNTWTTAPSVLVIDGVPRQKVQTDGTVMWTGTNTTVLTNAPLPTFDIFASA